MEEASGCWPRPLSNRAENSSVTPHITPHLAIHASSKKFLPPSNLYLPPPPPSSPSFFIPFHHRHERVDFTPRYTTLFYRSDLSALVERYGEKTVFLDFFFILFFPFLGSLEEEQSIHNGKFLNRSNIFLPFFSILILSNLFPILSDFSPFFCDIVPRFVTVKFLIIFYLVRESWPTPS